VDYSKKTKEDLIKEVELLNKKLLQKSDNDIVNKKEVASHLKINEEKYRTLFTKNLAGVFITEKEIILDCNNSFAKIFGYNSRVELIGKNVDCLYFSKKDRDVYVKKLNENNFLINHRIKHKNKNGKEIWISTNVYLKNNGRIEGTLVEITEQIRIEEKLKQSQKNYKELTENSPYGVCVHIDGKIVYVNKKASEIIGLSYNENDEYFFYDYILPENHKSVKERTKRALNGEDVPFKEFIINKPLTNNKINIKGKPTLFNYKGLKAVQVVFNDITLEKELYKEKLRARVAEESNKILQREINSRKKIEEKLLENQKYTQNIINSSLDIICASDKKGNIIEFNSAAEKAFGYTNKESSVKKISFIYASKKDHLKVSKQLKETGSFIGEIQNIRKNGEIFTSFLTASVLFNEKGEHIGTMGVSRDITELKEAEEQLIESEERYKDILENATDLIQSLDKNGNIIYVNEAWKKALGYNSEEIIGKNIFELIHQDCFEKCKIIFNNIKDSSEGEKHSVLIDFKTKKGDKITVKGNVGVKFKNNKIESTRSILRDVTEEIWENTKTDLYNNIAKIVVEKVVPEEIYEGIRKELGKVMNTEAFVISYSLNENEITFPYYYDNVKLGGIINKEDRIKGNGINEYFLKQKKSQLFRRKELDNIIQSGGYNISGKKCKAFVGVPLKIRNKTIGVLSVQSYDNENEYSQKSIEILDFISGTVALIVQRKQDQTIIGEQSAKLKSIIENSTHLFWTYDKDKGVTSSNRNFIKYIEETYNKNADLNIKVNEKRRFSNEEQHIFWDKKYKEAFNGFSQYFISKKQNIKGDEIVKEVFLNPIYNTNGKIVEISGIAHDITEKTFSEQKLKESLKEKEVLLKEVHHRVKNNLQVISSILNLQSSYVKDKKTLDILRESQNRIKSMSFIHESLYQTTDFSEINFSEYVVSLSKNLVHSYGIYDDLIDLNMSVGKISLNLDLSIPCGLIINELVSNAIKYAFSDKEKGEINIELFEKNDNVHLIVQDNGLGLPKEINYKETDSLGLQLVTTLVEQINGKIELDNNKGAKFTITFKKEQ
jgi:PAS domain S-box-containing protein